MDGILHGMDYTQYMIHMRPLLRKQALYSDETEMFVTPMEPDPGDVVTIRFRTARNDADRIYLHHEKDRIRMHFERTESDFDYYSAEVLMAEDTFAYYFEILAGKTTCYYDRLGTTHQPSSEHMFRIHPGFHTPDWAKGCVMYQIFVDRFRNGDPSNDVLDHEYNYIHRHVHKVNNWYQMPENMDVQNFYGGDLQGVLDKLDYLQKLGIQAIYLNPVFVSPSNHKYDTQDYDYIDPHFGKIITEQEEMQPEEGVLPDGSEDNTRASRYIARVTDRRNLGAGNDLFIRLVEEAHRRGMKVILDGVFNHCGSFNKWMDRERIYENQQGYEKGAYIAEDSPYHSFFQFNPGGRWPFNGNYDSWWGNDTLPKLNYENSRDLQKTILRIGRKWVSPPYNADGWRLDVAADLGHSPEFNHAFWKEFRKEVKDANPEAIILAEHYGDADAWLGGDEWDTVMNYDAFMEPVSWFLTGMEKHSDAYREDLLGNSDSFADAMRYHMTAFSMPSLLTAMNELDNHDHSRFLTRTNHRVGRVATQGSEAASRDVDKAVLQEAVVIQMTWPGAPTVYYGDEAGLCGFTDPDNRRTYPWGMEDDQLIDFYRTVIGIHNSHEVLRTGSVIILHRDYNVLVYGRFNREEQVLVCISNRAQEFDVEAEVWPAGISKVDESVRLKKILECDADGYTTAPEEIPMTAGNVKLHMAPKSALILLHSRETDIRREQE
ncbi:MAG: glycoside hydrolase family 13 protein [Lachnospiraceae bacterium]|nr:glycoside hydrolase family 13 protein [Lachnospiraceae bacterium]